MIALFIIGYMLTSVGFSISYLLFAKYKQQGMTLREDMVEAIGYSLVWPLTFPILVIAVIVYFIWYNLLDN